MKRVGNLKNRIVDIDNIALAAYKTFKGHRWNKDVISFCADFEKNIYLIYNELKDETIIFGHYHYFKIFDPKERLICAAQLKERIVHHSIMNICHDVFDKMQIFDSYASRKGKGSYKAIEKVKRFSKTYQYFAKLDIRKYFDSIDHDILFSMLTHIFKDNWLLRLFKLIIDSYSTSKGKGIPIGNLSSQYFANLYLCELDHYMKEHMRINAYVRYMDDIIILADDKNAINKYVNAFFEYANKNLLLEVKPPFIGHVKHGIPFLGYRVFPYYIKLSSRSKRRYRHKLTILESLWKEGYISEDSYSKRVTQLFSFVSHADSRNFQKECLRIYG